MRQEKNPPTTRLTVEDNNRSTSKATLKLKEILPGQIDPSSNQKSTQSYPLANIE